MGLIQLQELPHYELMAETPTSKSLGKRAVENVDGLDLIAADLDEASATKEPKIICLKSLNVLLDRSRRRWCLELNAAPVLMSYMFVSVMLLCMCLSYVV
jgi:hypothetical protein